MLDENITLAAHDPLWISDFNSEASRINNKLKSAQIYIEHIGSTAVNGLISKPIVDILVGLSSMGALSKIENDLVFLGYEYLGEAGVPGRYYFRKRDGLAFNVHVVLFGSELWINNLLLRDYLKNNKEAAAKYGEVKLKAVKDGANTLLAYSDHKYTFIQDLLKRAIKEKEL